MLIGIEGVWNLNYNWDENYYKGKYFILDKDVRDFYIVFL